MKILPTSFLIAQNYPNPFNPSTKIVYEIPAASHVSIEIFNILGQKVKNLVNQYHEANFYSVDWDGTDQAGQRLATGLYFYKIISGEHTVSKKMMLLK